jgi:hypothetical protein
MRPAMLVSGIRLVANGDRCELRADVRSAAREQPFVLWFRLPANEASAVDVENGDPFVAACLLPAMRLGETLEVDAALSEKRLDSVEELQSVYRSWDRSLSRVDVRGAGTRHAPGGPRRNGLFFSLGLDSFYSLLKNVEEHPDDDRTIDDLIVVNGFDHRLDRPKSAIFPTIVANAQTVAKRLGKRLLPVETNLRALTDPLVNWAHLAHGAGLASVGLLLDRTYRKVHVASSLGYACLIPWGSHPLLDLLWSTEHLTLQHADGGVPNSEKAEYLGRHQLALDYLRVCPLNRTVSYNCGECSKCLGRMMLLHLAGALSRCKTLPTSIDPDRWRALPIRNVTGAILCERFLGLLGPSEQDRALRAATEDRLARYRAQQAGESAPARMTKPGQSDPGEGVDALRREVAALRAEQRDRDERMAGLRGKNADLRAKLARTRAELRASRGGGLSLLVSAWRRRRARLGGGAVGPVARSFD